MNRCVAVLLISALVTGCHDRSTSPTDLVPPAAPRGLRSITGDHEVFLSWLANTEGDVAGYRVYVSDCGDPDCRYDRVGQTRGTSFTVTQLPNGQTSYFAVLAYDEAGNQSELSYDNIFDTPRPEGFGLELANYYADSLRSGYDFSTNSVENYSSSNADIFFAARNGEYLMYAPWPDTEIQDAGYATTLDAVDYAPLAGWSPTATVELIVGHCYVAEIGTGSNDAHFAKFRVTAVTNAHVVFDWAYQIDPGNQELRARPVARVTNRGQRRPMALGG
jgi:hypothetical protein